MSPSSLKYLLKEGFKNVWCNRTMSLASVAVLVSCLLLTGAAVVFSMNVNQAMESLEASNSLTVYLDDNLNNLESIAVGNEIKKLDNIDPSQCVYIPKDDAIQKYTDILGEDGEILSGLMGENNPLPNAYRVTLIDLEKYDETVAQISALEGVYKINDVSDIADKLTRMDQIVKIVCICVVSFLGVVSLFIISNTIRVTMYSRRLEISIMKSVGATDQIVKIVCICVVSFLGVVSLFIISNTIRVTMYSRRLEISIMKSVGATNGFIRIPFVVEGMIIGLISGALSSALLLVAYGPLAGSISGIMASFQPIPMGDFAWWITLGFLGAGILFGMVGGLISMGKYLKKEGDAIDW